MSNTWVFLVMTWSCLVLLVIAALPSAAQSPSSQAGAPAEIQRPNCTPQAKQAREAYLEAVLALGDDNYPQAVAALERAVRLDPTNAVYASLLARVRQQRKE